ncbi:hypothetical protein CHUAL_010831 [Chamberlinius hualienensis]
MTPDKVVVNFLTERDPLTASVTQFEIVEDLCFEAARVCGIGPVARHLFALQRSDGTWIAPCRSVSDETKCSFEFRMRFQVPDVGQLQSLDENAVDYYFHQIRHDFLKGHIPEALKNQDKILGLAVTDMFRVTLEKDLTREIIERDFKKYIPRDALKSPFLASWGIKKAMHSALINLENGIKDAAFIKVQYINQLNELSPTYGREDYEVQVDKDGAVTEVKVAFEPFNKEKAGLWMYTKARRKMLPQHVCTIEELCFVSMRNDDTVEISRKNGVPQYFKFDSTLKMHSFIGVLDGYYRLMEKWTFNLCKDLPTPFLQILRSMKCHGPVGWKFSCNKLLTKRNNESGCYIVRMGRRYNTYRVDICMESGNQPVTLEMLHTSNGFCFIEIKDEMKEKKYFSTISELLLFYNEQNGGNTLKECIPPSEYDDTTLLLCKVRSAGGCESSQLQKDGINTVQCINTHHIKLEKILETSGRMTAVMVGTWNKGGSIGKLPVALKTLKKSKHEPLKYDEFLQMANSCVFWHDETIVSFYGITLYNPLALVMEYLPLGSLDIYLQSHRNDIQSVDLVEAAVYLGKALWYLEERNVVHGNICCKNLLVAAHDESSFKIKLADPGVSPYNKNRIHWIPPECYANVALSRSQLTADVWAFGTTLWEIFSYGQTPLSGTSSAEEVMMFYQCGGRLLCPEECHPDAYKLMGECWCRDPDGRKKPQAIVRDINQILYEVHNSRRRHSYAVLQTKCTLSRTSSSSSLSLATQSTAEISATISEELIPLPKHRPVVANGIATLPSNKVASTNRDILEQLGQLSLSPSNVSLESMVQGEPSMWVIEMHQLEMKNRLGQGFYGEVHRALLDRYAGLEQQEVAVKQLRTTCALGHQDLLREIAIMKSLQHKNIVEIKGVVEDPKTLLVMEYVPLGSMLVYINTHKERLSEKLLLKYSLDVAEGMEYLAHKRIVHRDLAARNILVASEDTVKISDFGLAQKTGVKDYYKLKTNRDLPVRWYAPETLRMWKFTSKSDVWSFGITLYEMFSYGKEPIIEGCKDDELLKALEEGKRLGFPGTCSLRIYTDLMKRCWEGEPDKRPSFSQLLIEIKKLYDDV